MIINYLIIIAIICLLFWLLVATNRFLMSNQIMTSNQRIIPNLTNVTNVMTEETQSYAEPLSPLYAYSPRRSIEVPYLVTVTDLYSLPSCNPIEKRPIVEST